MLRYGGDPEIVMPLYSYPNIWLFSSSSSAGLYLSESTRMQPLQHLSIIRVSTPDLCQDWLWTLKEPCPIRMELNGLQSTRIRQLHAISFQPALGIHSWHQSERVHSILPHRLGISLTMDTFILIHHTLYIKPWPQVLGLDIFYKTMVDQKCILYIRSKRRTSQHWLVWYLF